jgi:hypothetical protein
MARKVETHPPGGVERASTSEPVAIGLVPHTGWTWLVRVCGPPDAPRVESRARIVACDVLEGELYHLAAERTRDRERFVEMRRALALAQATEALRTWIDGVQAAVVLGKRMALPAFDRIIAAHPLIHGAEGELWRAVFAEACAVYRLAVAREEGSRARDAVVARQGRRSVDAFLAEGKRTVGAPWTREPQDAALAAWNALADTGTKR